MFRLLSAFLAILVFGISCTDGDPAGVATPALISFSPTFGGSASQTQAPISRIRVRVSNESTGAELSRQAFEVSPSASSWELAIEVDVSATGGSPVILSVELISVVGGVETVEWSGRIGPIDVTSAASQVHPVTVYPGPLENLDVQSVTIVEPGSTTLVEGQTLSLQANVVSPGGGAQAIWSSLDGAVATVSATGLVTTHRNGNARIVAQAGPRADTLALVVRQRLVSVSLTPDSVLVRAVGDTAQFTARGLDPRGGEIPATTFTWTIGDPNIAQHVGGGRFRTLRHGATTVMVSASAPAASSPEGEVAAQVTSSSSKLVVMQGIFELTVSPEELAFTALGRTAPLTATAKGRNGSSFPNPVLTWRSTNTGVATVTSSGVVRSVAEGEADIIVSADGLEASSHVTVEDLGGSATELIVAADIDLFSVSGGTAANNPQLARNLAPNGERPYVIWYIGNSSYFTSESQARNYWAPLANIIENELGLELMVVGANQLGLLAGIPPEMVASVWIPMPHQHFTEAQLDQFQAFLAVGGRIVLFAEHSGFAMVNEVVESALFRLGSDVTINPAQLVGNAQPLVQDPLTAGVANIFNNATSWFTLGASDVGLFAHSGMVVLFRAGLTGRRLDAAPPRTPTPTIQPSRLPTTAPLRPPGR